MTNNIIIVDDHPNNLRLLMSILTEHDYRVRAFISGKLALNGISKEKPDLILLDINMPEMDGYETCRCLKSDPATANIPVLFLSALGETSDKVKGFDVGGVDFITKPFEERELLARIKTHLELKKAREKLEVNNQFLAHVNKVKNDFLGMVSHDLQSPLNKILMFSKYIEDKELSDEKAKELAAMINKAGLQMFKLVMDLLDLNQIEQGEFLIEVKPIDLMAVLNASLDDFRERLEQKGQKLETDFPLTSIQLETDATRLQQILDNIISNAIKFSPLNSTIQLKVEETDKQFIIAIQDQGPGLSEADQQQLFQQFTKLSARPTGGESSTGLGLSIVKQLVEALKGRVWCESELGQGACFFVALPK